MSHESTIPEGITSPEQFTENFNRAFTGAENIHRMLFPPKFRRKLAKSKKKHERDIAEGLEHFTRHVYNPKLSETEPLSPECIENLRQFSEAVFANREVPKKQFYEANKPLIEETAAQMAAHLLTEHQRLGLSLQDVFAYSARIITFSTFLGAQGKGLMTSPQSKRKVLLYHSTALHERLVYHIFRKFDDSVLESVCDTSEITHIYRQLHKHATALEDTIRTFLPQMRSHNSQRERVAAVFFEKNIIDVMSNMLHITKKTVETQETAEVVFGEDAQDKTNASDLKETADRYWNVSILGRDLVSIAMALEKEEEVVLQDSYIFLSPANEEEFIASGRLITRDNFKKFELSGGEKEKIVMANGLERVISVPGIESLYFWVTAEGNISIDKLDPNLILELLAPQQYEALRMHILYALCGYMNAEYRVLPPREALKKSSGCSTEPSTDSEDNSAVLIPRTKRTIRPQDGEKPPPESQITRNLKKRDSHSRILYNGGMPGKKAFEKAQANKRVELWAWVEDPNAQNPDDIITPLERIDTHPNYLAFLDWAHELRETHRAKHPEKRVLFQTYIKAFRKDETVAPVQERVTEVLSRGKG